MQINFEKLNYKQQVRVLKKLALQALDFYSLELKKIKFINHGENTTFKLTTKNNKKFLIRVCREGYHTQEALLEELSWLKILQQQGDYQIPVPAFSNKKELFVHVKTNELPRGRNVVLFKWSEGHFLKKTAKPQQLEQLGQLMAKLHLSSHKIPVRHRRYWTAEGLLGKETKFGSIDQLFMANKQQQKLITQARKKMLSKIKKFQRQYPTRQGLIHADFHIRNFLFNKKGLVAIDFDDCGLGFYGYDVAIPMMSIEWLDDLNRQKKNILKEAFFKGYKKIRTWDEADEKMLDIFITARRLSMLGWFNSRQDNPRLKKYSKKYLRDVLIKIKEIQ